MKTSSNRAKIQKKRFSKTKVILILVIASFGIFIFNFDKISEKAPPRYRSALEKINDLIFGKIQIIEIKGNNVVTKDEILTSIYKSDVLKDDLILLNSVSKIRKSLLSHPLIKKVNIKRFLPNKMVVYIQEKTISAKFYNIEKQTFESLEDNGYPLPFYNPRLKLPLVTGECLPKDFADFYEKLKKGSRSTTILPNISDISCFFGFRFDIVLNRKTLVNLPEENVPQALFMLESLIRENKILDKSIKRIDLTVNRKIFIEYFEKGEIPRYKPPEKIITMEFK